jgi:hypothetical protein
MVSDYESGRQTESCNRTHCHCSFGVVPILLGDRSSVWNWCIRFRKERAMIIGVLIVVIIIELIVIEVRLKKKLDNDERIIERLDLMIKDIRELKNKP